ncbi:MAG: hypothetical protein SHS37scaffold537_6 [Phage 68_12]|nr:MAG: hypothetical protein SHS37scaffold537_6 [Phage 68_12]
MTSVTARAQEFVALLKTTGKPATLDVTKVDLPGYLVIPIPKYAFGTDLDGGSSLTWTVYAIAKSPGNLQAAKALEELVVLAAGVLDFETADPTSYTLPSGSDPFPAYSISFSDDLEVTAS